MSCPNCDPNMNRPYRLIITTADGRYCKLCGDKITLSNYQGSQSLNNSKWDQYFYSICIAVADKSPCLSRKIGAVLVKDKSIVATGYNGPSREIPHCGVDRYSVDKYLQEEFKNILMLSPIRRRIATECPRKVLGYESGTHMELCPAQHAEVNAISNAARLGVSVLGSALYMNCIIPCKNCFGTLINAGIVEIIVDDIKVYDEHTQYLIDNSDIKIRRFEL